MSINTFNNGASFGAVRGIINDNATATNALSASFTAVSSSFTALSQSITTGPFTVATSSITGSILGIPTQSYADVPGGTVSITNTVSCSIYVGATFVYNFLDPAGTPQNGLGDRHRLLFDNAEVYEVFPVQPFPGDYTETITYTAYNIAPGTHTAKLQIYNPDTVVGQYSASYFGPGQIHAIVLAGAQGPSGSQGPAGGAVLNGPNTFNGTQTINGDVVITGNATAKQYIVSSSIYYVTQSYMSGSTKFGDTQDDVHEITGSLSLTGSHSGILPNLYHYGQNQYSDPNLNMGYFKRYYSTPFSFMTFGGTNFSANCIYTSPFIVNESRTVSQMAIRINNISGYSDSTGSWALGIYNSTSNVYPGRIMVSSSQVFHAQSAGVTFKSSSLTPTVLNPGLYWLAIFISGSASSDNINPQFIGGTYASSYSYPVNMLGYTENDAGSTAVSVGLTYANVSESFATGFPTTFPVTGSVTLSTQIPWIGVYFSA